MSKQVIGLIGHGFVGEALEVGMRHAFQVLVHDTFKYGNKKSVDGKEGPVELEPELSRLVERARVIFVCVPTPMRSDGSCDTSIVESVVKSINIYGNKRNIVVIKSTVAPGTTDALHLSCNNIKGVAFNPEFLTEANHIGDFKNQNRVVIGCEDDAVLADVGALYELAYPNATLLLTEAKVAEMVKYTTNCFLATKVSFANEIFQICEALGTDYNSVIEYAKYDGRLGNSHWKVPGPMPADDGTGRLLPGFSGSCFVKDMNSLIHVAKTLNVDPKVLSGAWQKNLEVRPGRDWENLKGRAVNE